MVVSPSPHTLLLDLASGLSETLDLDDVLERALAAARRLVDFRGGSIALVEEGALRVVAAHPAVSPEVMALRLPVGQGLSGRVAADGKVIYSPDLDSDTRVDPEIRAAGSNRGIVSYFAVPVMASGEVVGVLQMDSPARDAFTPEQRGLLASLAPFLGAAIQNARAYQAELDAQQRGDELEELRGDFIAITTHELRTPLTLLLGFAELLRDHGDSLPGDTTIEEVTTKIEDSLVRLELHVNELQRLALLDAGSLELDRGEVDVAEIVGELIGRLAGHREFDVSLESARVWADRERLRDALRPLLDNAVKFSPAGSTVHVHLAVADGSAVLDVRDEGPGVSSDDAERIFDRFAQSESPTVRQFGGLGIGLSIARALIERMDGRVEVVPGQGGCFRVTMPLAGAS